VVGSFLNLQEPDNKRVYNLKSRGPGRKKAANEFFMMNQTANSGDKQTTWWSVLLLEVRELAHNLTGKS